MPRIDRPERSASLRELSITEELGLRLCPWAAFAVCSLGFARPSTPENVPKPSSSRKTPGKKAARRSKTPRSKKADRQEDFVFMDRMEILDPEVEPGGSFVAEVPNWCQYFFVFFLLTTD